MGVLGIVGGFELQGRFEVLAVRGQGRLMSLRGVNGTLGVGTAARGHWWLTGAGGVRECVGSTSHRRRGGLEASTLAAVGAKGHRG